MSRAISAPYLRLVSGLLLAATLLPLKTAAEIYRYTDAQGNVIFTDQPVKGAQRIDLPPMTTYSPANPANSANGSSRPKRSSSHEIPVAPIKAPDINIIEYTQLRIVSPAHDSAFHAPGGEVVIEVTSEPALGPKHQFELLFDNQPSGRNRTGQFRLNNVDRGTHTAQIRIVSIDGSVVKDGASSTFTVHRPSALRNNAAN